MSGVFLDTVGLLALWDEADQWHSEADVVWQELVARRTRFLTTTCVLLECGNAAARRPYREEVNRLRRALAVRDELIVPTEEDMEQAWGAYDRGEAGDAGIVDQVSFQTMRRLGMTQAFTNDRHYRAAGFEVLL